MNNACDVAPQKYSIAGQRSSFDLAAIVRQVDYTGGGAVVDVKPGRADLWNTVLLKRRYGDTSVTITFADDYQIRTSMRDMLRRKLLQWPRCAGSDSLDIPGLEPVVQVEIMEVRWTPWSTDVTTARDIAERLGRKPAFSRTLIKTVTHPELVRIWSATKSVRDVRVRRKAEEQLISYQQT
eukprot:SAG11_NODE_444_length_9421_cov_9.885540_4_plen_181_part_00